jgi:DNA processing protein
MDYRRHIIALREFGKVGPKGFQLLLLHFGSPDKVFSASVEEISSLPRVSREKAETILAAEEKLPEVDQMLEYLEANNIQITTLLDENYPELLKQIDDPPPLLYFKGEFPNAESTNTVAIVGTTKATQPGIARAVALGKGIVSRGGIVVSGLATGIDAAGHLGALANNGKTYAVLGSGFNNIYPPDHLSLAQNISQHGAMISEYAPKVPVNVGQLMARNRIVVGLSQAVILVGESPDSEGSADAAIRALNLGRPLYVFSDSPLATQWRNKGALLFSGEDDLELILKYL